MDPFSIQADSLDRTSMGDPSIQNPAVIDSPIDPIESLVEAQLQAEINAILYHIPTPHKNLTPTSDSFFYRDILDNSSVASSDANDIEVSSSNDASSRKVSYVRDDGIPISSNGKASVIAHQVDEHILLPGYPKTNDRGILHIIHTPKNPLAGKGQPQRPR
ncbi:uncharacterized protein N7529_002061 [Penicillium soppii]|uniref:uncharacterized protein n=1 Tax=Penicillium soppii TaxID=69789 RepID=UPI002549289D|nr:uncharacterized protein N7529_002061 [Penicillium soppii]KAJ5876477.1 hypothetical protein N7529_002061 [Penicillium soppii]